MRQSASCRERTPRRSTRFRVGLRRLRSTLRAFRPWLAGGLPAKSAARLRKNRAFHQCRARRRGPARLARRGARASRAPPAPGESTFYSERYRARIGGENGQAKLLARYARVSARLSGRFSTYESEVAQAKGSGSFGGVLASLLAEHLEALREAARQEPASVAQRIVHKIHGDNHTKGEPATVAG